MLRNRDWELTLHHFFEVMGEKVSDRCWCVPREPWSVALRFLNSSRDIVDVVGSSGEIDRFVIEPGIIWLE